MQKGKSAKALGARRIHPSTDGQANRDVESPSPPSRLSPAASIVADAVQRGAGPRRNSLNSVGSAQSDSSKDEGRSPGIPSSFALGKRRTSINSLTSVGSDDSERRLSHFSAKVRTKSFADPIPVKQSRSMVLNPNFKVPAILLLSNKLFNAIYVTSKKMFVMAVLSVFMCVIENEIWFSVYMAKENADIVETSKLVLSESQKFRANICKLVLSACTALLCYYITVYYKELLEIKRLKQSDLDSVMHDQSKFLQSGLVWWYLLEMFVCLIHIPYGMDVSLVIEFRSIKAFYRGEMIVTLVIFLRLYHVVRVIRDWTLIRFKNAMFLSKLVHVEQNNTYALKVLLHENPVAFVLIGLFSTLVLFGYLLRAYDTTARPLDEAFGLSQAYWISMLSLTTVGYGDDVPKSHLGRIMVVLLVYIGSILIPLQIAIVERLLQFNMQEDRMIRVYRLEQRRHAFQKAAVKLVVSWYRSLKSKKTDKLSEYIGNWKKFRMTHASTAVHDSAIHNEIDKNVAAVAASLRASLHELELVVSKQAIESKELSRRCSQNTQAMQLVADKLANMLHGNNNTDQIRAKISSMKRASFSSQDVSCDSTPLLTAKSAIFHEGTQQNLFAKTNSSSQDQDLTSGDNRSSFAQSVHTEQLREAGQNHTTEQPRNDNSAQLTQPVSHRKSSVGNQSLAGNEGREPESLVATQRVQGSIMMPASPQIGALLQSPSLVAREPMSVQTNDPAHQFDTSPRSHVKHNAPASDKTFAMSYADNTVYSSTTALSHMPSEINDRAYVQNGQQASIQHQMLQTSRHNTYHNQSADAAFSQREFVPGLAEVEVPIEGFYPPPHSYSPEAIQFHRDRIYEQARPSLNSILRSSPGLIPNSETARIRPATYYSSKSPPVPLLTRPNSPGPKGFTPVRVKPFNPQGVVSPLQGSAPAGSSSAYAKFLLARSEYKPESNHHSP